MPHFLIRNTVISDRRLPLPGRVVVLGRSLDADVPIPHESVSQRHALLEATPDGFMISDLGSRNGTVAGGRKLGPGERAPVALGAAFRLGSVDVILARDEPLDAAPLTLAPPPNATASAPAPDAVPERPGSGDRGRPRRARVGKQPAAPAAGRRSAKLRRRRRTFFWVGIALTVILLGLAAFFIYRIASRGSEKPASAPEGRPGGPHTGARLGQIRTFVAGPFDGCEGVSTDAAREFPATPASRSE